MNTGNNLFEITTYILDLDREAPITGDIPKYYGPVQLRKKSRYISPITARE